MDIHVTNVTIEPKGLQDAISQLDAAIAKNQRLKALCEELLRVQGESVPAAGRRGRRGRPKGSGRPRKASNARSSAGGNSAGGSSAGGRRRAGQPTLADVLRTILAKSGGSVRPKDLRDRVLRSGYQTKSNPDNFYVTVYNTAKKAKDIVKTDDGFALGTSGGKSAGSAKKASKKKVKKRRKKTAKKATQKRRSKKAS